MKAGADSGGCARYPQSGSILMLVLFMCLAVAVVIQTVATVVVCAERALSDELAGRTRMAEKDAGLAVLRQHALTAWAPAPWAVVSEGDRPVEGTLAPLTGDGADWVMEATVRQEASASRIVTSAWVERGRDGLDLPLAAIVAESLTAAPGREQAWLEVEPEMGDEEGGDEGDNEALGYPLEAAGYICELPAGPALGAGCSLVRLAEPWRLDAGWSRLFSESVGCGLTPGLDVTVLTGPLAWTVRLPEDRGGLSAADPVLVVVTGGVDLDAEDLGDFYGVVVVDDGSVSLEGTTVHGAVFATEAVHLGETGRVLFARPILRWATDRSLARTRLLPGSRSEGTE